MERFIEEILIKEDLCRMDLDKFYFQTKANMLENGWKVKCMEMENSNGRMDHFMMGNINMGKNMGLENLDSFLETIIKGFGMMVSKAEEESFMIRIEIN